MWAMVERIKAVLEKRTLKSFEVILVHTRSDGESFLEKTELGASLQGLGFFT